MVVNGPLRLGQVLSVPSSPSVVASAWAGTALCRVLAARLGNHHYQPILSQDFINIFIDCQYQNWYKMIINIDNYYNITNCYYNICHEFINNCHYPWEITIIINHDFTMVLSQGTAHGPAHPSPFTTVPLFFLWGLGDFQRCQHRGGAWWSHGELMVC